MDSGSSRTCGSSTELLVTSFFSLPIEIREDIYKRVLTVAHPLYIFQGRGCRVETFAPDIPRRWLALLHANRQIHQEASGVLYRSNHFNLVDTRKKQADLLQSFLNCIGSLNAGFLSHLCISFPAIDAVEKDSQNLQLSEDGLRTLKILRDKCTSLTTLEMFVPSRNFSGITTTVHDNWCSTQKALLEIDAHLNPIRSLHRTIVRVWSGTPTPSAMELMQGLGWVVLLGDQKITQGIVG
jgi:hypothetical protein